MRGAERSLARSIRGPVTLITIGALFALNNFTPYRFDQTWPVILIVFGLLTLLGRATEPAAPPPPGYYPGGYPAAGGYTPGSYSRTPYAQPPAAKPADSTEPEGGAR
jgi:hypothetical protein